MRTRPSLAFLTAFVLVFGFLHPVVAQTAATPAATPVAEASPVASQPLESTISDVDLDVLFIGAHPDDEAFGLAAYGQWNEYADVEVGVITVTRGEGGGNAVGTEEGPALGLIREREERAAVSHAGISHIYNLDKVDFYYTVSAPLTVETWGYEDTLARVVRVIRATTPEVIITMNPAPTPGNHGHHQVAARLAVDAFTAAADAEAFPDDAFEPWTVSSIYQSGAAGEGPTGEDCATSFAPVEATDTIFGVWQGTVSERNGGRTWGEVARDGQRTYASQGWAVFPDAPTDPAEIQCNYFTLIDSRVAISPNVESPSALLENAVLPQESGLPLGTTLDLSTDTFTVAAGDSVEVSLVAALPADATCDGTMMDLQPPFGWAPAGGPASPVAEETDSGNLGTTTSIQVPVDAEPGRYAMEAGLVCGDASGFTRTVVQVVPAVSGVLEPLPEIAQFQEWAGDSNVEQLNSLIAPVTSIAVGETKTVNVVVTNNSTVSQSGTVTLELPAGFEAAEASSPFDNLGAGAEATVSFTLTNTDPALATSNEGGEEGTYPFTITTEAGDASSTQTAGLNLVPSTVVPRAGEGIAVDGQLADGEYTGEALDLSRVWEGEAPESTADASGSAHAAWTDEGLYIAVEVTDDTLGTVLTPEDAKRHWRTDSVEIAIDPLGTAANTSATFKVGVFPTTTEGQPAAYRDADAHQGPVADTAPGVEVASAVTEPYTGYVLETFIPFDVLPAEIDPAQAAMNLFIYDSDTEDLTGQTRLGWSTWNGVQGDPYRWGAITLADETGATLQATPVVDGGTADVAVDEPVMPLDVALSTQSPLSIAQSAGDGVPLAGMPPVATGSGLAFSQAPILTDASIDLAFEIGTDGTAEAFVIDVEGNVVTSQTIGVQSGVTDITIGDVSGSGELTLLVSFLTSDGRVQALSMPVRS
jgi:LmbE family N-acetylglucosaminyl deacetylase